MEVDCKGRRDDYCCARQKEELIVGNASRDA